MVGVFIWKCLIFPQNPFHKSHKALSPTHCYRRGITLREENILFGVSSQLFTRFSNFAPCSTFQSRFVPILFESRQVWVFRISGRHRESDFSREIGLFHTCRGFRSTSEIFRELYEAFMDLQNWTLLLSWDTESDDSRMMTGRKSGNQKSDLKVCQRRNWLKICCQITNYDIFFCCLWCNTPPLCPFQSW